MGVGFEVYAVLGLGLAAATLSFVAEATRVKQRDVKVRYVMLLTKKLFICEYPSRPDATLASLAAAILFSYQVTITNMIIKASKRRRFSITATTCFIFSLAATISGVGVLATGAKFSCTQKYLGSINKCYTISAGYYLAGGLLALKALATGLASYDCLSKCPETGGSTDNKHNVKIDTATVDTTHSDFSCCPCCLSGV